MDLPVGESCHRSTGTISDCTAVQHGAVLKENLLPDIRCKGNLGKLVKYGNLGRSQEPSEAGWLVRGIRSIPSPTDPGSHSTSRVDGSGEEG